MLSFILLLGVSRVPVQPLYSQCSTRAAVELVGYNMYVESYQLPSPPPRALYALVLST